MKNTFRKINHFLFHLTLWPILILSPIAILGELTSPGFMIRLFTAIGIPEEWVPVLQKAGYNLVSDLKDGNAQKIQQEIGGINKKYKLNYTTPSVNDVTEWVNKLS